METSKIELAEDILRELKIDEDVVNIYPYGSHVYGNATDDSDRDYVIVTKSSMLSSGAFKENAISNRNFTIQGILYSRSGFMDALNNYDITALECIFLDDSLVIQKKWPFKLSNIDNKVLAKKLISKASMSLYSARNFKKRDNIIKAKKGTYHAIRILVFGNQIKEHGRIIDYSACNNIKRSIDETEDFHIRNYNEIIEELTEKLKS